MKRFLSLAALCAALGTLSPIADAAGGVFEVQSSLNGVPGTFFISVEFGPPPHFEDPQFFRPANGGPDIPLGGAPGSSVTTVQEPGGALHRFSTFQHPSIPNLVYISYHYDLNGDGNLDPGEPQIEEKIAIG